MTTTFGTALVDEAYPPGVEDHYWSRARHEILARALERHGPPGRILDVGCGRGVTVGALRARGFDVTGVEAGPARPLPDVAPHVRTNTGLAALPLGVREHVDTALLLDVLEHVEDPAAFVEQLLRDLPELELLVVTVPARPELWSNYDEHYGHFRRYRRNDLARVLGGRCTVVELGYIFHALYAAARVALALRPTRPTTWSAPTHKRLHALVGKALALEARALPSALPGSSLLAVVRPER